MAHNLLPFKPITYNLSSEVKNRFQSLPFKCNLQRYIMWFTPCIASFVSFVFGGAVRVEKCG
jgi:hypothetical protein